jgi:hypothetical protein
MLKFSGFFTIFLMLLSLSISLKGMNMNSEQQLAFIAVTSANRSAQGPNLPNSLTTTLDIERGMLPPPSGLSATSQNRGRQWLWGIFNVTSALGLVGLTVYELSQGQINNAEFVPQMVLIGFNVWTAFGWSDAVSGEDEI